MMTGLKKGRLMISASLISIFLCISMAACAADPNVRSAPAKNLSQTGQTDPNRYTKPFEENSLWKSRPVSPTFSDFVIPRSAFNPNIHQGTLSSGCFFADQNSPSVTVKLNPGQKGVYDADAEAFLPQVEIPHWPADVVPAPGGDGHADIFDVANGVIHSFWKLRNNGGQWTANLYAWSPLNGSGWPDPAHYYRGARAVGVSACAGIIRKQEFESTDTLYPHALAMSLAQNGMAPGYVFPATSADVFTKTNRGKIPEGSLVMLPPDFDTSKLKTPELVKIANTLKVYGAYIIDRNDGTPFIIYVENGSGLNLNKNNYSLNLQIASELHSIRESLRMVTSVKSWLNEQGQPFTPEKNLNILSMRGPWCINRGSACVRDDPSIGKFDTWKQAVVFGNTKEPISQSNPSGRGISQVEWAKPQAEEKFKLTAKTTGGGKLRFIIRDKKWNTKVDSYNLENDQSLTFIWPKEDVVTYVYAISGIGKSSSVSGTLVRVK
jgi:hypothetical protein